MLIFPNLSVYDAKGMGFEFAGSMRAYEIGRHHVRSWCRTTSHVSLLIPCELIVIFNVRGLQHAASINPNSEVTSSISCPLPFVWELAIDRCC